MNYFKQGSFFYGKRQDGKYIQVATFNGLTTPAISVVSYATSLHQFGNEPNIQITAKEFKHTFAQAILDITLMDMSEFPEIKHDELNESDVQKS